MRLDQLEGCGLPTAGAPDGACARSTWRSRPTADAAPAPQRPGESRLRVGASTAPAETIPGCPYWSPESSSTHTGRINALVACNHVGALDPQGPTQVGSSLHAAPPCARIYGNEERAIPELLADLPDPRRRRPAVRSCRTTPRCRPLAGPRKCAERLRHPPRRSSETRPRPVRSTPPSSLSFLILQGPTRMRCAADLRQGRGDNCRGPGINIGILGRGDRI